MAFCNSCGSNIPDGTKFCPICGVSLNAVEKAETDAAAEAPYSTDISESQDTPEPHDTYQPQGEKETTDTQEPLPPVQAEVLPEIVSPILSDPIPQAPEPPLFDIPEEQTPEPPLSGMPEEQTPEEPAAVIPETPKSMPWETSPPVFTTTLPAQPLYPSSAAQSDIPPAQPPSYQPPAQPAIPKPQEARPPKGSPYAMVGTFKFIGLMILFSIPLIGWIFCIVMAFSAANRNIRNYARAGLILALVGIAIALVGYFVLYSMVMDVVNSIINFDFWYF